MHIPQGLEADLMPISADFLQKSMASMPGQAVGPRAEIAARAAEGAFSIALREVDPGVYEGTYTLSRRDVLTAPQTPICASSHSAHQARAQRSLSTGSCRK